MIDCYAHDGLGDSSQKLLDKLGCPIDEFLMPIPLYGPIRPIALMHHQEAYTSFPAFKFPDRDRLHFSCGLQLCTEFCPKVSTFNQSQVSMQFKLYNFMQVDCGNYSDTLLSRNAKNIPEEGEILDRIEVFNSVEVLAPEIDDVNQKNQMDMNGKWMKIGIDTNVFVNTLCILLYCDYIVSHVYIKFIDALFSFSFCFLHDCPSSLSFIFIENIYCTFLC